MYWIRPLVIYLLIIELIESVPSRISTKMDLELDDQLSSEHSTLKTTIDRNEDDRLPSIRTLPPIGKQPFLRPHNIRGFARINRPRQKEVNYIPKNAGEQPLIINNIKIIMNSNETLSKSDACKNTVCNVSVTSKAGEDGNLITDVHLSIITKLQPRIEVDNIPVIDGVHGTGSVHEDPPVFYSVDESHVPRWLLPQRNIPQIQVHYHNIGEREPWHQSRKSLTTPRQFWRHAHNGPRILKTFHGHNSSIQTSLIHIDDKIDLPISKTTSIDKDRNKE